MSDHTETQPEDWRPIVGYEGSYEVSSHGRVRSLDRLVKHPKGNLVLRQGRILAGGMAAARTPGNGYRLIILHKNGKGAARYVHRLVAEIFIPNPENKPQINHKDGRKTNNQSDNLEWCTCLENRRHAFRTGLCQGRPRVPRLRREPRRGETSHFAKITTAQAQSIILWLREGVKAIEIARRLHIKPDGVYKIKEGKTWKHLR